MNGAVSEAPANRQREWLVPASRESLNCHNPIRMVEEQEFQDVLAQRRTDLDLIKLSIGDTAALTTHPAIPAAVKTVLDRGGCYGYGHSCGLRPTREAIASLYSSMAADGSGLSYENVVMASGCSGALDLCISALCNPGQNILIPSPGFGLYTCIGRSKALDCRFYRLLPESSWEVDLEDLESKIDQDTAAIIFNNPSNPCGSSYSRDHLMSILAVAERHRLPIVSDETYDGMAFPGEEYHPLASLSHNVPILTCGGMAKKYLIPGWRIGWIIINDRNGAFKEIATALPRLSMKVLGPNTLAQTALPDILRNVPQEYYQKNLELYHSNATICCEELKAAPGLNPIMPKATMYIMVVIDLDHFPEYDSDVAFMRALVLEQCVFCLPGKAFNATQCFRIVLATSGDILHTACKRITAFCHAHYIPEVETYTHIQGHIA